MEINENNVEYYKAKANQLRDAYYKSLRNCNRIDEPTMIVIEFNRGCSCLDEAIDIEKAIQKFINVNNI